MNYILVHYNVLVHTHRAVARLSAVGQRGGRAIEKYFLFLSKILQNYRKFGLNS